MEKAELVRLAERLNMTRHKLYVVAGDAKDFLEDRQNRDFQQVAAEIAEIENELVLAGLR